MKIIYNEIMKRIQNGETLLLGSTDTLDNFPIWKFENKIFYEREFDWDNGRYLNNWVKDTDVISFTIDKMMLKDGWLRYDDVYIIEDENSTK